MNAKKEIPFQIEKIKALFQTSKDFCHQHSDITVVTAYLENTDSEFRSIAYEGASMALALKDLEEGGSLNQWNAFLKGPGAKHERQLHSGLGWAIAQERLPILPFFELLSPLLRSFVLDGCGYYDGIFKQRQTIKNQKIPETLHGQLLEAYDQGLGRSLWYILKGEEEKIKEIISTFPPERQSALWRGIGVACVFVGGSNEIQLKSLFSCAGEYQTQLAIGAVLVARSRTLAKNNTPDVELACKVWCNLSAEQAMMLSIKTEPSLENADAAYGVWLSQMKMELVMGTVGQPE